MIPDIFLFLNYMTYKIRVLISILFSHRGCYTYHATDICQSVLKSKDD